MEKYYLDNSNIHGTGAFASRDYPVGTTIGKLHTILKLGSEYNHTELGEMYNHSDTPNTKNVLEGDTRYMVTIKPVKMGEELTADYRLQPDLEQPETFHEGGSFHPHDASGGHPNELPSDRTGPGGDFQPIQLSKDWNITEWMQDEFAKKYATQKAVELEQKEKERLKNQNIEIFKTYGNCPDCNDEEWEELYDTYETNLSNPKGGGPTISAANTSNISYDNKGYTPKYIPPGLAIGSPGRQGQVDMFHMYHTLKDSKEDFLERGYSEEQWLEWQKEGYEKFHNTVNLFNPVAGAEMLVEGAATLDPTMAGLGAISFLIPGNFEQGVIKNIYKKAGPHINVGKNIKNPTFNYAGIKGMPIRDESGKILALPTFDAQDLLESRSKEITDLFAKYPNLKFDPSVINVTGGSGRTFVTVPSLLDEASGTHIKLNNPLNYWKSSGMAGKTEFAPGRWGWTAGQDTYGWYPKTGTYLDVSNANQATRNLFTKKGQLTNPSISRYIDELFENNPAYKNVPNIPNERSKIAHQILNDPSKFGLGIHSPGWEIMYGNKHLANISENIYDLEKSGVIDMSKQVFGTTLQDISKHPMSVQNKFFDWYNPQLSGPNPFKIKNRGGKDAINIPYDIYNKIFGDIDPILLRQEGGEELPKFISGKKKLFSHLMDALGMSGNFMAEAVEGVFNVGDQEFNAGDIVPSFEGDFSFTNQYGEPVKSVSKVTDLDDWAQENMPFAKWLPGLSVDIATDPLSYVGAGIVRNLIKKGSTKAPAILKNVDELIKKGDKVNLEKYLKSQGITLDDLTRTQGTPGTSLTAYNLGDDAVLKVPTKGSERGIYANTFDPSEELINTGRITKILDRGEDFMVTEKVIPYHRSSKSKVWSMDESKLLNDWVSDWNFKGGISYNLKPDDITTLLNGMSNPSKYGQSEGFKKVYAQFAKNLKANNMEEFLNYPLESDFFRAGSWGKRTNIPQGTATTSDFVNFDFGSIMGRDHDAMKEVLKNLQVGGSVGDGEQIQTPILPINPDQITDLELTDEDREKISNWVADLQIATEEKKNLGTYYTEKDGDGTVYYESKNPERETIAFSSPDEYNDHRQNLGLPQDWSMIEERPSQLISVDDLAEELEIVDNELMQDGINTDITINKTKELNNDIQNEIDNIKNGPINLKTYYTTIDNDVPFYKSNPDLYFDVDPEGGLSSGVQINKEIERKLEQVEAGINARIIEEMEKGTDVANFEDVIVPLHIQKSIDAKNLVTNVKIKERLKANETIDQLEKDYYKRYESEDLDGNKIIKYSYSIEDAEAVKKIQQDVTDAGLGYMLGAYGPNADGIDGKYGPKTRKAVRQMLANQINAIDEDYNFKDIWDPEETGYNFQVEQCDQEGCAAMVVDDYRETGIDVKQVGMSGNHAWTMFDSMLNKGGSSKYNVFDENFPSPEVITEENKNQVIAKTKSDIKEAIKNNPFDVNELNKGDVVGIFFPGSEYHGQAIKEGGSNSPLFWVSGDNPTYNTHVGYVVGYDTDGMPLIKHQISPDLPETDAIEGRTIIQRADNIVVNYGSNVKSQITWVMEPAKFQINAEFDDSEIEPLLTEEEMDISVSNYISNLESKVSTDDVQVQFDDSQKEFLGHSYEILTNVIPVIANELDIVAPHSIIRDLILAKMNVETGIAGSSIPSETFVKMRLGEASRKEIKEELKKMHGSDWKSYAADLIGEDALSLGLGDYHEDSGDVSRGLFKTKLNQQSPLFLSYFGLNDDNIDNIYNSDGSLNYENINSQLYFEVSNTLRTYNMFNGLKQRFNAKFVDDPLTDEDVLNMTIMAHNQGSDVLNQFTQTGRTHGARDENGNYIHEPFDWEIEAGLVDGSPWDVEDYIYNLRRYYRGDVKDISSTKYKHVDKVIPGFGDLLYDMFVGEHESYISKTKRYMDNKNVPWTQKEIEEYKDQLAEKRDIIMNSSKNNLEKSMWIQKYVRDQARLGKKVDFDEAELKYNTFTQLDELIENLDDLIASGEFKLTPSIRKSIEESMVLTENVEEDTSLNKGGEINKDRLYPEWDDLEKELIKYNEGKEISENSKKELTKLGFIKVGGEFNKKTEDKYKDYSTDMIVSFINLPKFRKGGDINLQTQVNIYQDYINGKLKGKKANDVYDKLNRFYYYDAKEAKMPIFDYMKRKLKEA